MVDLLYKISYYYGIISLQEAQRQDYTQACRIYGGKMNKTANVAYRNNVTHSQNKFRVSYTSSCKLYYFHEGCGGLRFFVNGTLTELKPGQVIFIPQHAFFAMTKKNATRYARCISTFPSELLTSIAEYDSRIQELAQRSEAMIFTLSDNGAEEYRKIISMLDTPKDGLIAVELITRQLEILTESLCVRLCTLSASDALIGNILKELEDEHLTINSAEDVARRLGYSKNYISSYFKNKMNLSLHDFLTAKKLFSALMLLGRGVSVTDAAYECGFSSASHFISIFKSHYGSTPKRYIKTITEKSDIK